MCCIIIARVLRTLLLIYRFYPMLSSSNNKNKTHLSYLLDGAARTSAFFYRAALPLPFFFIYEKSFFLHLLHNNNKMCYEEKN